MIVNHWPIAAAGVIAAGVGLGAWGAVHPSAQLFGPTVRRTGRPRTLALTFDDGPNPAVTPCLLDLLEQHQVRATFFVIGRFVRQCPELVREINARGHALANHTETHPNLVWLSRARIREELRRCQEGIAQALGDASRAPRWMRPPYGFRGPQLHAEVRRRGLQGVVMWSLTNYDWKPQPAARLIKRLRRASRGGDIVLLHDGDHRQLGGDRLHVAEALRYWLPRWRDAGLEFVTIDEIDEAAAAA